MTDFSLSVEVDHTPSSQYHNDGRVILKLVLTPESAKAFYEWMADGCVGKLLLTKDGCEYQKDWTDNKALIDRMNDLDFARKWCKDIPWESREFRDAQRDPEYCKDLHYWDNHKMPEAKK